MKSDGPVPGLAVNEIRDYRRVNAELARLLDSGAPHVRLLGVEGQRLLASELVGGWKAVVEVVGAAGPEFGAGLDAPGLTLYATTVADGAARGLEAGRVVIGAGAGDVLGYEMAGGVVIAIGRVGHRAGLRMQGGLLALLGPAGRLVGDRQSGGHLAAIDPGPPHGQLGGERWSLTDLPGDSAIAAEIQATLILLRSVLGPEGVPEPFPGGRSS